MAAVALQLSDDPPAAGLVPVRPVHPGLVLGITWPLLQQPAPLGLPPGCRQASADG